MRRFRAAWLVIPALGILGSDAGAAPSTNSRTVEFRFVPTARTQIALWVEKPDGTFVETVRLTQAVAVRGIGNRPGATEMNSGFRWPYGRREGVLPVWAHRRAAAPGAMPFRRVIFQDRKAPDGTSGEGFASRTSNDSSAEAYFCLSFMKSDTPEMRRQDAMDAVTCASAFNSDKGRFFTTTDDGYGEPAQLAGQGIMRPLEATSLYPPRRDVVSCHDAGCADTADVAGYPDHVRSVMPEIDTVTMATPAADSLQSILYTPALPDGSYVAWLEVNTEGDYNGNFNDAQQSYPTPLLPADKWDYWAMNYGYSYRGQPSVVYVVPFTLGPTSTFAVSKPAYYGDVDGFGPQGGSMHSIDDGLIGDDPVNAPGSGADRLRALQGTDRVQVLVRGSELCQPHDSPAVPTTVTTTPVDDEKHSHEWGHLHFVVPASQLPIVKYEVRYSINPISDADPQTFEQALPAYAAKLDTEELMVPVGAAPGASVDVSFGGLAPLTTYYVAIRAVDMCNVAGPYAVARLRTTRINFTQLSGCFVATAAYGSALDPEVESLRVVRDALRPRSGLAAAAVDLYYRSGPAAAAVIERSEAVRAVVRHLLEPIVGVAKATAPWLAPGPGSR